MGPFSTLLSDERLTLFNVFKEGEDWNEGFDEEIIWSFIGTAANYLTMEILIH